MANIKIGTVNGGYNVFGDRNNVINNFGSQQENGRVLTRDEYFQMILEIREVERISLGHYLEDKFEKYSTKNPDFVKILYKDINKILEGVDNEGDNDLLIENGDFVKEYGDYKRTGNPTNLHYALTWLYMKLVEECAESDPENFLNKINYFERDFLSINYDTPSYARKISELNADIKKEKHSKSKSGWSWNDFNEIFDLKPNFMGLGLNLNAVLSKLFGKKKQTRR